MIVRITLVVGERPPAQRSRADDGAPLVPWVPDGTFALFRRGMVISVSLPVDFAPAHSTGSRLIGEGID